MLREFLILALAAVSAKSESILSPCAVEDKECLKTAMVSFLSKTYGGIPDLDIKKVDPLLIPSTDVNVDDNMGIVFKFNNMNITGIKDFILEDMTVNMGTQSAAIKIKGSLKIVSNIEILLTKFSKRFNGDYAASTNVVGVMTYPTSLETINGKEYFMIGQETVTCEIANYPVATIGDELQSTLFKDPDVLSLKPDWEGRQLELTKKVLCDISKLAFHSIVHNIRAISKKLPKEAFFKNV